MQQDIGQFEVSMHDLVVDQCLEGIQDLVEVLQNQFLWQFALFLDHLQHVPAVAVLQHQVVVVRGLLQSNQFDDVRVVAGLKHFDFVLQQLVEFAWDMDVTIPLIMSRLMVLMATT